MKGKVSDICPKCKNCKSTTQESNGVHVLLTEVKCEDPHDGMVKTLTADSDVCCSMFEVRKEKEPFNLNMPREENKAIAKLNDVICELEKENETLNSKVEVLEKKLQKADSIRDAVWNESKLNQTISDQEVTIKALLITIKEMCKEENENA